MLKFAHSSSSKIFFKQNIFFFAQLSLTQIHNNNFWRGEGIFCCLEGLWHQMELSKKFEKKRKKLWNQPRKKKFMLSTCFFSVQTYDDSKIVIFFLHIVRERRIFLKVFFVEFFRVLLCFAVNYNVAQKRFFFSSFLFCLWKTDHFRFSPKI